MLTSACLMDESVRADELEFMCKRGDSDQAGISGAFIEEIIF